MPLGVKVIGVSRVADNEQTILVSFNRKLTDNELRAYHQILKLVDDEDWVDWKDKPPTFTNPRG